MGGDGHKVVQHSCDLAEQRADPLGTIGDLDVQQLLNGERETLFVGHDGDIVETIEVGKRLYGTVSSWTSAAQARDLIPGGTSCTRSTSRFHDVTVRRGDRRG